MSPGDQLTNVYGHPERKLFNFELRAAKSWGGKGEGSGKKVS